MRKLLTTLFVLFTYFISLNAQINGSVKLGVSGYQGDLHCRTDENIGLFKEMNPSFGVGVRVPFTKTVGFRGEATYFRLTGDESQFKDGGHAARGWSFKNNLIEVAGLVDWEPLAKRRYKHGRFRRTLTPVIFGGVGAAFTNSKVDFKNATGPKIDRDKVYDRNVEVAIPVGLGLKYYLSPKFAVAVEGGLRLPVSDYYDGVSRAGVAENNDGYGFAGVKAYFGLGGKKVDTDNDGIVDKNDSCPDVAGTKATNGCPDSDCDGVGDDVDKCPFIPGTAELNGCSDKDRDGVMDSDDPCPMIAGPIELNGCPDEDGDGINDLDDLCPKVAGNNHPTGCPDRDGDGVVDKYDDCPDQAGVLTRKGCPLEDSDEDGVPDEEDDCPEIKGSVTTKGCPDSDKDGVADRNDKCPDLAGEMSNGCPKGVIPFPKDATVKVPPNPRTMDPTCDCSGNSNSIFNIPSNKRPRNLTRLGTNPEFGNSHDLDAYGFYEKLKSAHQSSARDRRFLDNLFQAMGYSGFSDATPDLFSETEIQYGQTGNIGYSINHKTLYARLNAKSNKDLMAFRIRSANGCDIHFMKTCGNHFFFCP